MTATPLKNKWKCFVSVSYDVITGVLFILKIIIIKKKRNVPFIVKMLMMISCCIYEEKKQTQISQDNTVEQ